MRKPRHRDTKKLVQSHTASKWMQAVNQIQATRLQSPALMHPDHGHPQGDLCDSRTKGKSSGLGRGKHLWAHKAAVCLGQGGAQVKLIAYWTSVFLQQKPNREEISDSFIVEKQKCDTCKDWTLLIGLVQKCRCVCVQLCSLTPLRISSHHGLSLQFLSPGLLHHLFKDVSGFTLFPPVHTFHQGQLDLLKTSMKSCHPFA